MTPRVHQFLAAAAPNDAVTNQAVAWRTVLAAAGIGGEIAAEHIHPEMAGVVMPLDSLADDGAPIILRYSIWSRALERARAWSGRVGIVYHNITPPHLVGSGNPVVAELCARGRRELPSLAKVATLVVADSTYNAEDLVRAGYATPVTIPLLLDLPDPPPARPDAPPTVLYVGRIAPSKRIEDVIATVAAVRERYVPDATLDLVGAHHDHPAYHEALVAYVGDLGLGGAVRFRGRVDDAERDHAYRTSGAYLSMSEHEGFCAPLLEAMAMGLPVIARGAGAVPETVGDAGLVVHDRDIAVAAAAVARVLHDPAVRQGLAHNARARLADVSPDAVGPQVIDAVSGFIS